MFMRGARRAPTGAPRCQRRTRGLQHLFAWRILVVKTLNPRLPRADSLMSSLCVKSGAMS